tara:strand:- start:36713 stop:37636 length:924 start_codon:yes stop_codon:yes gene_type:complete
MNQVYRAQVELLLKVLPYVAQEKIFALKGGTAINLFVRNMPRLSVDIDLSYLPFDNRATALSNITDSLERIKKHIEESKQSIRVAVRPQKDGSEAKFSCQRDNTQIIIEVNTTIRGHLLAPKMLTVAKKVQDEFEQFAEIMVISNGELFGGKICAALDRQHPRDLFDVHYLLKNEAITHEIKLGFMACVLSHPRPIHELLNPNFQDQREAFVRQFSGMSFEEFTYENFENTRQQLINEIKGSLDENDIQFLLSFKRGEPDWDLFEINKLKDMPAVKWKLLNIQKLKNNNKKKHKDMLLALEQELEMA